MDIGRKSPHCEKCGDTADLGRMIATFIAVALAAAPIEPRFEPSACPQPVPARARCGVVRVPENPARPAGRTIALHVVVIPAVPSHATLPPLFDIDGGPGLPASKNASFYAGNGISRGRDVVMIDQRGTGRSNPLLCPGLAAVKPTEPMLPEVSVRECRNALQAKADLRFYGTADAIEDLEAVRRALGYGKIDLFGLSYGTTVALRYMRRHPANVRAVVLMGTSPPSFAPPQHHATAGQRALDLMFADCAAQASCNASYPALRSDLALALRRLSRPGAPLSPEIFMERLRGMFYAPAGRASVPRMIHRAARGDLSPILGQAPATGASMIADGMFLAVTCGESFPLMDYRRAAAAARKTRFGDYRLRRQRAACRHWPRVRLDPDHLELPVSNIPVLLISGGMDPVTPPEWAEGVARRLRRARHLVLPTGGHIPDGLTGLENCLDPLMIDFLVHADPARIDASCIAGMKAPLYLTQ